MTVPHSDRIHRTELRVVSRYPALSRHQREESLQRCESHRCLSQGHMAEMGESAIPPDCMHQLGWYTDRRRRLILPYRRPDGTAERSQGGKPFVRWKPTPGSMRKVEGFGKPPKYLSPRGGGNRLYHAHLALSCGRYAERLADCNVPLVLTEGEKKAESLAVHWPQVVVVGLAGVWSWKDRRGGGESQVLPELEEIPLQGREVFLLFDSDAALNSKVLAALEALGWALLERGAYVRIIRLPSELDGRKNGVDDLIHRHGPEALRCLVDIAQPAFRVKTTKEGDQHLFQFPRDPEESHFKALLAAAVLRSEYRIRPGVGVMHWCGSHWVHLPGKTTKVLGPVLHRFMDHQGWQKRSLGVQNAVLQELVDRIELPEERWATGGLSNFANGTYEHRSGRLREHRRGDLLLGCLPYDYEPRAVCPCWERFIAEACGGDAAVVQLVQAVFRYVLEPKDRLVPFPLEKCFDFEGRKGTGKGTCVETLMALAGEELVGPGGPKTFCDERSLAPLVGKTMACDTDAAGHLSDAGLLNKVISNEAVAVRFLYQEQRMNRLGVVLVRAYNDAPTVAGGGVEGLDRRIVVIPFLHRPEHPDPNLKAALRAELSGIWQWTHRLAITDAIAVIRAAGSIDAIAASSVERHLENNPVTLFVLETYPHGISEIGGRELYRTWCNWCEDTGHQSGSETLFGRRVKKLTGLVVVRKQHTRVTYAISPASTFDLPAHLGVKPNPLINQRVLVKPSAVKPVANTGKTEGSEGSEGFLKSTDVGGGLAEKQNQEQVAPKPSEPSDSAETHCAAMDLSQIVERRPAEGLGIQGPRTAATWVEEARAHLLAAGPGGGAIDAAAIHQVLQQWGAGVSRAQVEAHCHHPSSSSSSSRAELAPVDQMSLFANEAAS